jgi:hypothetical protein
MASLALLIGIGFEAVYLLHLLQRKASLERSVGMASAVSTRLAPPSQHRFSP